MAPRTSESDQRRRHDIGAGEDFDVAADEDAFFRLLVVAAGRFSAAGPLIEEHVGDVEELPGVLEGLPAAVIDVALEPP
jgi:hypothetical protein